jgi:hypothetical protein
MRVNIYIAGGGKYNFRRGERNMVRGPMYKPIFLYL